MRGKAGLFSRLYVPPSFSVFSASSFSSASGDGTELSPVNVLLSGNTSPAILRQVTLKANVGGTFRFSVSAAGSSMGEVLKNGSTLFGFAGGVDDGSYSPISIAVNDQITLVEYAGETAEEISGSFWIQTA